MNNKGMTLAEIIVSVALISIVLIFMMKLLLSLRYEDALDAYDKANSVNRTEIMHAIQEDFKQLGLPIITQGPNPSEDNLVINFKYNDITKKLVVRRDFDSESSSEIPKYVLEYGTQKWKLLTDNNVTKFDIKCIPVTKLVSRDYVMFQFVIPVDNGNESGSTLDDIEILYIGPSYGSALTVPNCFGKDCETSCSN